MTFKPIPITIFFDLPFLIFDSQSIPPIFFPLRMISFGHFKDIEASKSVKAFLTDTPHISGRNPILSESISRSVKIEKATLLFFWKIHFLPLWPFPLNWSSVMTMPEGVPLLIIPQASLLVDSVLPA